MSRGLLRFVIPTLFALAAAGGAYLVLTFLTGAFGRKLGVSPDSEPEASDEPQPSENGTPEPEEEVEE